MAYYNLEFFVNNTKVVISSKDVTPTTTLSTYLRQKLHITSTKVGCEEGSCGACTVLVQKYDKVLEKVVTRSVNACLCLLPSIHNCCVYTSAGLGNFTHGLTPVQQALTEFYGTQCGFCTPGIAVACQAVLERAKEMHAQNLGNDDGKSFQPSPLEMERGLDGNYCRCTGYRPVLDAAKSVLECTDIEDLGYCQYKMDGRLPAKNKDLDALQNFPEEFIVKKEEHLVQFGLESNQVWYAPQTTHQLDTLLEKLTDQNVRFVGGNTGTGIFKNYPSETHLISLADISEFRSVRYSAGFWQIGAAATIDQFITALKQSKEQNTFVECAVEHLQRVAGPHVRNMGTVVGNIVLAATQGLESDIVTILAALGAQLTIQTRKEATSLGVLDFVNTGGRVLKENTDMFFVRGVEFSDISENQVFWSTKIGAKSIASHPIANVAILAALTSENDTLKIGSVRCIAGFSQSEKVHDWCCKELESVNKFITDQSHEYSSVFCVNQEHSEKELVFPNKQVQKEVKEQVGQVDILQTDSCISDPVNANGLNQVNEQEMPQRFDLEKSQQVLDLILKEVNKDVRTSKEFVKDLLVGLMFKGISYVYGREVASIHKWSRQLHQGKQSFPNVVEEFAPLSQPVLKLSSEVQVTGEADFTADIALQRTDILFLAPIVSTKALAKVVDIDYTDALKINGVMAKMDSNDVKDHQKSYTVFGVTLPIFPSDDIVQYVGQPIAYIIADTQLHAEQAATLAKINYQELECQEPVFSIKQAIEKASFWQDKTNSFGNPEDIFDNIEDTDSVIVSGEGSTPSQQHFYMETQSSCAWLEEGGRQLVVHCASQGPQDIIEVASQLTGISMNKIKVSTGKVGGAFGGKAIYNGMVSAPCVLAAMFVKQPVLYVLNRNVDLSLVGGRPESFAKFKCLLDKNDLSIKALDLDLITVSGFTKSGDAIDGYVLGDMFLAESTYSIPNLKMRLRSAKCNLPARTAVRAPGHFQLQLIVEGIMDHIAAELQVDPCKLRESNIADLANPEVDDQKYSLPRVWRELKQKSKYDERVKSIEEFNKINQWSKRGLALHPLKWQGTFFSSYPALVHLYSDGSILVAANGIEMGQGLYTKLTQATASELFKAMPENCAPNQKTELLEMIDVSGGNSTELLPNTGITGGSITSESTAEAVINACKVLVEQLQRHLSQEQYQNKKDITWKELVKDAFKETKAPWSAIGYRTGAAKVSEADTEVLNNLAGSKLPEGENPESMVYHTYAAACCEVEVDVLTGEKKVIRVDILQDVGVPLNPAVDLGQIEGAFVMGLGAMLSEEVNVNDLTGKLCSNSTWTYNVPSSQCIPQEFNVHILNKSVNRGGVKGSKCVGEPPLLLATSALSALRAAVSAALQTFKGTQISKEALRLSAPATVLKTKSCLQRTCSTTLLYN